MQTLRCRRVMAWLCGPFVLYSRDIVYFSGVVMVNHYLVAHEEVAVILAAVKAKLRNSCHAQLSAFQRVKAKVDLTNV